MKNLTEYLNISNLYDYILESLINSKELNDDMKFVECSFDDIKKIIDTDDYEHGKVFNMSSMNEIDELAFSEISTYYTINYKDNIIGLFGYYKCGDSKSNSVEGRKYNYILRRLFLYLLWNELTQTYPDEYILGFDSIKKNDNKFDLSNSIDFFNYIKMLFTLFKNDKDKCNDIIDIEKFIKYFCLGDNNYYKNAMCYDKKIKKYIKTHTNNKYNISSYEYAYDYIFYLSDELASVSAYIPIWGINQKIKRKLDINDFAIAKVFFNKLLELCNKDNVKYIMANGKDEKTGELYIKLGKFKSVPKLAKLIENKYNICYSSQMIVNNFVIKDINNITLDKMLNILDSSKPKTNKSTINKTTDKLNYTSSDELVKYLANKYDIDEKIIKYYIIQPIKNGYIVIEDDDGNMHKYGYSRENILAIDFDDLISYEKMKNLINDIEKSGIKFKHEKDSEWKKLGWEDPNAD